MYHHNRKQLDKSFMDDKRTQILHCNCKKKEECPMDGGCNSENIVYQASIFPMESRNDKRVYLGISTGNWKQRLYNCRYSFSNPLLRKQAALLKCFGGLKEYGLTPQIKLKIIRKPSTACRCNLCLEKKGSINNYKDTKWVLNK